MCMLLGKQSSLAPALPPPLQALSPLVWQDFASSRCALVFVLSHKLCSPATQLTVKLPHTHTHTHMPRPRATCGAPSLPTLFMPSPASTTRCGHCLCAPIKSGISAASSLPHPLLLALLATAVSQHTVTPRPRPSPCSMCACNSALESHQKFHYMRFGEGALTGEQKERW